jgi:hypothetical protein
MTNQENKNYLSDEDIQKLTNPFYGWKEREAERKRLHQKLEEDRRRRQERQALEDELFERLKNPPKGQLKKLRPIPKPKELQLVEDIISLICD